MKHNIIIMIEGLNGDCYKFFKEKIDDLISELKENCDEIKVYKTKIKAENQEKIKVYGKKLIKQNEVNNEIWS